MRWDKSVIVVMNEVRVSNPYLPESVTGGTPAANDRVKKVVRIFDSTSFSLLSLQCLVQTSLRMDFSLKA